MTINFNTTPYFDDFDESKNFLRVLFRPGYAVQARELTQLQTSIQNQINKFGSHVFKNGSIVLDGQTNLYYSDYIDVYKGDVDISQLNDTIITGADTDATAKTSIAVSTSDTTARVYLLYMSNTRFSRAENVRTTNYNLFQIVNEETFFGQDQLFSINDSVFFVNGYFVFCEKQIASINFTNAKLGLLIKESVISVDDDNTLLDPAQGSYNYAAPGADRFSISLTLTSIYYDPLNQTEDTGNFIELARVENGQLVSRISTSSYSDLETNMARRTYDESGDYTVRAFGLKIKPHTGGDESKLSLAIDPGKAYIKGYEFETISTQYLDLNKARDLAVVDSTILDLGFGSYIYIQSPTNAHLLNYNNYPNITFYSNTGGIGEVIGTANITHISYYTPNVYRLGLININLVSGKSFANINSVKNGSWVANISLVSYENGVTSLISSFSKTHIVQLPNSPVHTLLTREDNTSDTEHQAYRSFGNVSFVPAEAGEFSGAYEATINTETDENFVSSTPSDYLIVSTDGNITFPSFVTGSNTSRTLSINQQLTNVKVYTRIGVTQARQRNKSLMTGEKTGVSIKTSTGILLTDKISLDVSDCYKLVSVFARNSVTNITKDVTSYYVFNTGQKDEFYDHGWIQLKTGFTIEGVYDVIDISFQYFSHSSPDGFFSVDSYNLTEIPYEDIPTFTSSKGEYFKLHSCLDFRPVRASGSGITTINGNYTTIPNTTVSVEYDYYLPRIDKLVLTKERKFYVVKGISADVPRVPADLIDAMTLYIINLPAYTANEKSVSFTYVDNRRFTMRDIGKIEKRVGRLEYYTTLSYLEKQAKDEVIPSDTPGIERFKNGILVDSFAGHSIGNPGNPDYKCSIDKENQILRPRFSSQSFFYDVNSLTPNVLVKENDLVHLKYDTSLFIENPFATTWVNVNPYMIFEWNGQVTLDPATDNWVDTRVLPDVTVNLNGENDVYTILNQDSTNTNSTGVLWNDWQTVVKGAITGLEDDFNIKSSASTIEDPETGGQTVTNTSRITNQRTTTTTDVDIRTGVEVLKSETRILTKDIGTKVVDTSIVPYVRSRVVDFAAKHLKPNTEIFATLDGVNVTTYCTPASSITVSALTTIKTLSNAKKVRSGTKIATVIFGNANKVYFKYDANSTSMFALNDALSWYINDVWVTEGIINSINLNTSMVTDAEGIIAGSFLIPDPSVPTNPKFRTGELLFRLSDTLSINSSTAAEVKYVAQGLSQSTERTLVATRVASATVRPTLNINTTEKTNTENIVVGDVVATVQVPPPPEPITIHCGESYFGDGRKGVWEYFIDYTEETSSTSKVGIKIGNTNGVPVKYTIIWDGKEFTTGFVGVSSYNGVNYNDILVTNGLTKVSKAQVSRLDFYKLAKTRKALLRIETPIAGTNWSIEPFCVEPPPPVPTYSIQPDKLVVAEGGIVTFTVVTTDVAIGTKLWWVLDTTEPRSISAADFADGVAAGELTVNAAGVIVFTKTLLADFITNENEIFVLDLRLGSQTGTIVASTPSISITDTSLPLVPTYEIQPDKTNVLEGDTVIFTVATTNVASGTVLKWEVDSAFSTTTVDDFNAVSGTITVLNNIAVFSVAIKEDIIDNEVEYFRVKLMLQDNTVVDYSPRINIVDSTDAPTFSITPNLRRINEGNTVDFNIVATGVNPSTTRIYWKVTSDSNVETADFEGGLLQGGPLTLAGNSQVATAVLSRVTVADFSENEGDEYFSIDIYTDAGFTQWRARSASVTIVDSSIKLAPTYSIVPQLPPGLRVDEGGAIPYLVSTTNVANGTTLYWRAIVDGSDPKTTAEAADFQYSSVSGSVVINNNNSGFGLQTITDELNEGNETVTVYLYSDAAYTNKVASAATVTIIDKVIPPPAFYCQANLSQIGVVDAGNRFLRLIVQGHDNDLTISESINFGSPVRASWTGVKNGIPLNSNVKYKLIEISVTENTESGCYPPVSPPRIKVFSAYQPEKYFHRRDWTTATNYRSIGFIREGDWYLNPPAQLTQSPPVNAVCGPNEEVSLFLVFNPYSETSSQHASGNTYQPSQVIPPHNITDNPIKFTVKTVWQYESGDNDLSSSNFNTLTVTQTGKFKGQSFSVSVYDPVAQTFFVDATTYPNGVFIKSIDLYFKRKSSWVPVEVQIRPVVNGFPSSSTIMPFGSCIKFPNEVNISTNGSTATNFEFSNIIHLAPGEYSFVVISNTDEYEIFSSEIGKFSLTNPDQRITTQPLLGSMFKSQNATTWTPIQEEDVKFRLYKCDFVTNQIGTLLLDTHYTGTSNVDYEVFYSEGEVVDFADTTIEYAYKTSVNQNGTKVSGSFFDYQAGTNISLANTKTLFANDGTSLQLQAKMSSADVNITPIIDMNRLSNILVKNIINNDSTDETLAFDGKAYAKYITRAVKLNPGFDSQDLKVFFSAKIPKECNVKVYYKISSVDDTLFDDNEYTEMILESASTWYENKYSEYKYKTPYTTADVISATGTVLFSGDPEGPPAWTAVITGLDSTSRLTVGKEFFATPEDGSLGTGGIYVVTRIISDTSIEYSATGGTSPLPGSISDIRLALTYVDASSMAFANGDRFDTFSVKLVMLSENPAKVPLIKDLRVIALDD